MAENGPGSSPLTRGKPSAIFLVRSSRGLIPAHAGKTRPTEFLGVPGEAHPRSRGENIGEVNAHAARLGSSPLTRGKRICCAFVGGQGGLIPAHAGKTW